MAVMDGVYACGACASLTFCPYKQAGLKLFTVGNLWWIGQILGTIMSIIWITVLLASVLQNNNWRKPFISLDYDDFISLFQSNVSVLHTFFLSKKWHSSLRRPGFSVKLKSVLLFSPASSKRWSLVIANDHGLQGTSSKKSTKNEQSRSWECCQFSGRGEGKDGPQRWGGYAEKKWDQVKD